MKAFSTGQLLFVRRHINNEKSQRPSDVEFGQLHLSDKVHEHFVDIP